MAVDYAIDFVKKGKWLIFITISILLVRQVLMMALLDPVLSPTYLNWYLEASITALGYLVIIFIFGIYRELRLGDALGLSNTYKTIIFVGFVAFMIVATWGAGQIIGIPSNIINQGFAIGGGEEVFYSSVVPAVTEDPIFLIAIPAISAMLILIIYEVVAGRPGIKIVTAAIIISMVIGGTVFASAHQATYGQNQDAYLGAWVFGVGQTGVYMTTGIFLPVAHIAHNAMLTLGDLYGINIGAFTIVG